jgi:predicted enzyme related to lactoylglutathione lyase
MITGGNATVLISNMDRAVDFYTSVLGLKLGVRYEDFWATIDAGKGTKGGMMLGFEVDEPIDAVVARLTAKGVKFTGPVVNDSGGKFAHFQDPDGNEMYLWEMSP